MNRFNENDSTVETLIEYLDACIALNRLDLLEHVTISDKYASFYCGFLLNKAKLYNKGRNQYQLAGINLLDFNFDLNDVKDSQITKNNIITIELPSGTTIVFRFDRDIDLLI